MISAPAPPLSSGLPLLGNALPYLTDPLEFLRSTRQKHGDVVSVALGPLRMTLVSHPDLVEDILVTR